MTELKPCPFCGGEVELVRGSDDNEFLLVNCKKCNATIGIGGSEDEKKVTEAWNNRPSNWHTELPTEDGQYFVAYRWGLDNKIMHDMAKQICYGATTFYHGTWKVEFPFVVLAWQKIEPFEEREEWNSIQHVIHSQSCSTAQKRARKSTPSLTKWTRILGIQEHRQRKDGI